MTSKRNAPGPLPRGGGWCSGGVAGISAGPGGVDSLETFGEEAVVREGEDGVPPPHRLCNTVSLDSMLTWPQLGRFPPHPKRCRFFLAVSIHEGDASSAAVLLPSGVALPAAGVMSVIWLPSAAHARAAFAGSAE